MTHTQLPKNIPFMHLAELGTSRQFQIFIHNADIIENGSTGITQGVLQSMHACLESHHLQVQYLVKTSEHT